MSASTYHPITYRTGKEYGKKESKLIEEKLM
jgi:hypothetical protein